MPMMAPVDSPDGLDGSSRFGDRIAGAGGLAAESGAVVAWVKSDGMTIRLVALVVVMVGDSDDAVTVCCLVVMCGPTAVLITPPSQGSNVWLADNLSRLE